MHARRALAQSLSVTPRQNVTPLPHWRRRATDHKVLDMSRRVANSAGTQWLFTDQLSSLTC